jgi:predicted TIM-barrel fold metal-dependent hydrolase
VDLLGGSAMLGNVASLNDRVPELRGVIDHLPFDNAPEQALSELSRRPKVFAKVSNVLRQNGRPAAYRESLENLWSVFGPDRLLYGSNWPVSDRVGTFAEVFKVVSDFFTAKGETAAEKYFCKNALIAYGVR